ncbi:hypothetical protein H5410_011602 [Solanum commersonii]|uniref:Uncharacterized protein n=4 Tax=Solanum TaxID=4107 RepID=A0ABQ7WNN2_SOLTU|nr:PREDICTED: uncharacterized protein LOC102579207 [Solanum tuberosum]XP_049397062.1 uncharacterized protein LOC125861016 [Solanum stenotomum]KAG5626384.1 hypothetical protein H5410_011602 [Solanum commersonii]KAH0726665.1 hypothetical protein KY284_002530 [Solanum tuberosum]KAH0731455.1 hypothetical protein KY289_002643 [Solanum tuberosum]KAH0781649.1 hypothetical protein KY290_001247 [Solanum tuberosum]
MGDIKVTRANQEKHISSSSSSELSDQCEELQRLEDAPPFWRNPNKKLSKQLSMCEIPRDIAWEKRRRQFLHQERKKNIIGNTQDVDAYITDEDLNELKGCIDLGFGFNEEEGQRLCNTLPALDLYFAVNRQYLTSPISSPGSNKGSMSSPGSLNSLGGRSSSFGSPRSDHVDAWKIYSPGDDPQQVKTKLRHWAQAVACSVKQSY